MNVPLDDPPLAVAEIFTVVALPTGFVPTGKVPLAVPALTVIVGGIEATAADPLTTARVTTVFWTKVSGKVTVPVVLFPPVTELGEKVTFDGVIAFTVNPAFLLPPFALANIFTGVDTVIWLVLIVQVAEVEPAGTITELGMDATAEPPLSMLKATVVSTATGAFKLTLAVVLSPPRTESGENDSEVGSGGVRVTEVEVL